MLHISINKSFGHRKSRQHTNQEKRKKRRKKPLIAATKKEINDPKTKQSQKLEYEKILHEHVERALIDVCLE